MPNLPLENHVTNWMSAVALTRQRHRRSSPGKGLSRASCAGETTLASLNRKSYQTMPAKLRANMLPAVALRMKIVMRASLPGSRVICAPTILDSVPACR